MSTDGSTRGRWDIAALRAGGSVALGLAVPLSVLASVLSARARDDGGSSSLAPWLTLLALGAFVIGAGVAAWHQNRGTPLSHGIVAAVGAYLVGQAAFVVYAIVADHTVRAFAVIVNVTLVAVTGTIGGFLGSKVQATGVRSRYRRPEDDQ